MALVQPWPHMDCHHNADGQQDKDSNDDGDLGQPAPWRWFPGPTQHFGELPLGPLPR